MTDRAVSQSRAFSISIAADEAERGAAASDGGIPVVISTNAVVEVGDGLEILVHSDDAVDLSRAPLPIIASHADGQVNVGLVDSLRVSGGQLRGTARFGKRAEAAGYETDVRGGIIRSVSIRYDRLRARMRGAVLETYRWRPSHVAMIAEPADIGAGFFRGAAAPKHLVIEADEAAADSPTAAVAAHERTIAMSEQTVAAGNPAADPKIVVTEDHTNRPTPVQLEQSRKTAIRNLAKANQCDDRYVDHWITSGASLETVADDLLKIQQERGDKASRTFLDMTPRETQRYSLMRALRAAQNRDWTKAGLELEANKAISSRLNKLPRAETAFFVPLDVMMRDRIGGTQQRDMTAAGVSGSNYLVGTNLMPGSFIELLRNTSVALRMGVQRMSGLVGNVTIPKMTAGNTAYWLADETTQITESQPTIGQLALSPKNVAALTELSHQLMQQSTPDAEQLVLDSIARDIALAVDVGILRGSGASGQPTGIATTGSIGAFTGTSLAAAGLLDAQADVAAANALNDGCGYVTTPAVAALLMARPELPSTGTTRMWLGNMREGSIFGMPALSSAQMLSATMLFGWWPSVVLAEWGVLELMTNPYSDFTRGLSAVRGWYTCDVGVRYAGAWSYATSIS
jgi:HK97 family phage major capsid protein